MLVLCLLSPFMELQLIVSHHRSRQRFRTLSTVFCYNVFAHISYCNLLDCNSLHYILSYNLHSDYHPNYMDIVVWAVYYDSYDIPYLYNEAFHDSYFYLKESYQNDRI